jgi:hypothetical protein
MTVREDTVSGSKRKVDAVVLEEASEIAPFSVVAGLDRLDRAAIEKLQAIYLSSLNRVNRATDSEVDRALFSYSIR